jgi:hypothetical protein
VYKPQSRGWLVSQLSQPQNKKKKKEKKKIEKKSCHIHFYVEISPLQERARGRAGGGEERAFPLSVLAEPTLPSGLTIKLKWRGIIDVVDL